MTAREKVTQEHPDKLTRDHFGGVKGCPHDYGYLPQNKLCAEHEFDYPSISNCEDCWNREIPEETLTKNPLARKNVKYVTYDEMMAKQEPRILDSGNRREFETGAVRDIQEGKGRCDLLPLEVAAGILNDEILDYIYSFQIKGDVSYLYDALEVFATHWDDGLTKETRYDILAQRNTTMFLEVAKHFEEGAKKYGENNWQKGIPVHCYIDSGVRHYLKFLRGDKDEPHDRAFCWNLMCAIWTCKHKPELNEYKPVTLADAAKNATTSLNDLCKAFAEGAKPMEEFE